MNNGENDWGVSFVYISWLDRALNSHGNVNQVVRHDDIVFDVTRNKGQNIRIICLDEYVLGVSAAQRVFTEFPEVNFIYVGGNWNGYTRQAKELCLGQRIGLFNSSEITGALWKDDFWTYHKRDSEGNPEYPYHIPGVA